MGTKRKESAVLLPFDKRGMSRDQPRGRYSRRREGGVGVKSKSKDALEIPEVLLRHIHGRTNRQTHRSSQLENKHQENRLEKLSTEIK